MKQLLSILLLFCSLISFGQKEIIFKYETLYYNLVSSYDLHIYDDHVAWIETEVPQPNSSAVNYLTNPNYEFEQLYKNKSTNEIHTSYKILGPRFYVKDNVKLDWELTDGSEKLLGYDCQVAKTTFRGRNYTAYYTTEIPIAEGPFKFSGLPGMILKVENDDAYLPFRWECVSIEKRYTENKEAQKNYLAYINNKKRFNDWQSYQDKYSTYIERFIKKLKTSKGSGSTMILVKGVPEIIHEQLQTTGITVEY